MSAPELPPWDVEPGLNTHNLVPHLENGDARMTIAEAELVTALDQLERLVDVMRRSDAAWCASHGMDPVDDEEWDEVLAEAEEYLEEMREEGRL